MTIKEYYKELNNHKGYRKGTYVLIEKDENAALIYSEIKEEDGKHKVFMVIKKNGEIDTLGGYFRLEDIEEQKRRWSIENGN